MSEHCVDDDTELDQEKVDVINFELDEPCQLCRQKGETVCLQCKKLLCYRCAFTAGHRDHTCKELPEARDSLSKRVEQIVEMNKNKAQRLVDVAGTINEQYTFISSQIQSDAAKLIRKIKSREMEMLTSISQMRETAREVIENEIDHYVANSSKSTETTLDLIQSLVELELAASTKKVIQLPQVNKIYVDFGPLEHQADNLRLEYRIEKREDGNVKPIQKTKVSTHHRLPLNHVFRQEMKFFFKIDVLSATSGLSTSGNTLSVGVRSSSPVKDYQTVLADRPIEIDLIYWEVNVSKSNTFKVGVAYRYMRPNRNHSGNMSQHSIADEWNCWSLRQEDGKLTASHRSIETPVFIPSYHTRNGRLNRLGILCDANAGKLSFVNATIRPRRIIYTFKLSFLKPLFPFFGVRQGSLQVITRLPPPSVTAG